MKRIPEITPELLQQINFEIIGRLLKMWRDPEENDFKFKDKDKKARWKFRQGLLLQRAVIDSIRAHPDIQALVELHKYAEEVAAQLAIVRKIHPITSGSK